MNTTAPAIQEYNKFRVQNQELRLNTMTVDQLRQRNQLLTARNKKLDQALAIIESL